MSAGADELIAKLDYREKALAERHPDRELYAADLHGAYMRHCIGTEPLAWHLVAPRIRNGYRNMAADLTGRGVQAALSIDHANGERGASV